MTVTKCHIMGLSVTHQSLSHDHVSHRTSKKALEQDNVIQYILHILTLRKMHGPLGQANSSVVWTNSLVYIR